MVSPLVLKVHVNRKDKLLKDLIITRYSSQTKNFWQKDNFAGSSFDSWWLNLPMMISIRCNFNYITDSRLFVPVVGFHAQQFLSCRNNPHLLRYSAYCTSLFGILLNGILHILCWFGTSAYFWSNFCINTQAFSARFVAYFPQHILRNAICAIQQNKFRDNVKYRITKICARKLQTF